MSLQRKIRTKLNNKAKDFAIGRLNKLNLPSSLLIIPDGNGRWAKQMKVSVSKGHEAGSKTVVSILSHFMKLDIDVMGIWGFSEDNWKREKREIDEIMEVIQATIEENLKQLLEKNVQFFALGKRERLKKECPKLLRAIENAEKATAQNTGKKLVLFIDYGERFQLEEFAKARAKDKASETYELLSKINMGLPLFDMVLRTSGEQRLSGFGPLAELAEFVSVKKYLPQLSDRDIISALKEYSGRQRRFGGR
ncbi:MAG: polyprenyl diphosphate synthase [Patescibacteria group bacterium]|nr:polyprenyl diphosphate synthase [Patescibacteria group bacterium]